MPLGLECRAVLPALYNVAKLDIGMQQIEVELLIGKPVDVDSHETGKRHITFYFCGDTQRIEAYYKNEGQLASRIVAEAAM